MRCSGEESVLRLKATRGDFNGAFGDLGTFLPYVVGAVSVGGLAVTGVLFGFGIFLMAAGLFFGLPMAVQPMKAVAAALLTSSLTPGEIATTGVMLGVLFLILGLTGGIGWLARMMPQSVTAGLQLGLGLAMAFIGLKLMLDGPWLGFAALAAFLVAARVTVVPLLPLAIVAALIAAVASGHLRSADLLQFSMALPAPVLPRFADLPRVLELAVLPQIPLTLANAIIVTAAVSRTLFPGAAARATERNLAVSTGLGNLLLAPLGALPMCHGAGGVVAQSRFGAASAAAPVILGALLITTAFLYGEAAAQLLTAIPLAAAGALLAIAGIDLAISKRLFDARLDCWPVIGATAAITALVNPAVALAVGIAMEAGRRHFFDQRKKAGR
jgi:hypothetical protein